VEVSAGARAPDRFETAARERVSWALLSLAVFGAPVVGAPATDEARRLPALPAVDWTVPALHTTGLFVGMRVTEAYLWPAPFAETELELMADRYREAYTRRPIFDPNQRAFEWDGDRWTINLIGHGLLGSELYYRPRRCGASVLGAFAFAAGSSLVWEYVFEANAVRPSAFDLGYTPVIGLVLGEARHAGYFAAGSISNRALRGFVRALLDPFGEIERGLGAGC
jgi:hypothetical protein